MWFIILLRWLVALPIFATPAPLLHATLLTFCQELQQSVWDTLDTSHPFCRLLRKQSPEYHRRNRPHPGMKGFSSTLAQTSCHPLKKSSFHDERFLPYFTWRGSRCLLCLPQRQPHWCWLVGHRQINQTTIFLTINIFLKGSILMEKKVARRILTTSCEV